MNSPGLQPSDHLIDSKPGISRPSKARFSLPPSTIDTPASVDLEEGVTASFPSQSIQPKAAFMSLVRPRDLVHPNRLIQGDTKMATIRPTVGASSTSFRVDEDQCMVSPARARIRREEEMKMLGKQNEFPPLLRMVSTRQPEIAAVVVEPNSIKKFRHIMRELQGDIIIISIFQCIMGFSCLMSLFLRLINPVVVAPTVVAKGTKTRELRGWQFSGMCEYAIQPNILR